MFAFSPSILTGWPHNNNTWSLAGYSDGRIVIVANNTLLVYFSAEYALHAPHRLLAVQRY